MYRDVCVVLSTYPSCINQCPHLPVAAAPLTHTSLATRFRRLPSNAQGRSRCSTTDGAQSSGARASARLHPRTQSSFVVWSGPGRNTCADWRGVRCLPLHNGAQHYTICSTPSTRLPLPFFPSIDHPFINHQHLRSLVVHADETSRVLHQSGSMDCCHEIRDMSSSTLRCNCRRPPLQPTHGRRRWRPLPWPTATVCRLKKTATQQNHLSCWRSECTL